MQPFRNILLYTDPAADETARCRAVELAIENKASLTLMNVVKPLPSMLGLTSAVDETDELQRAIASDRRRRLLNFASGYSDTGVAIDVVITIGDPAYETARQVVRGEHDLLIKTADGFGLVDRMFGSVSQSLLRLCPCPVWLLKPDLHGQFDCVVAAVDATSDDKVNRQLNQCILEQASLIAKRESAALHVVSAWNIWMEEPLRIKMGDVIVDAMAKEYEANVGERLDVLLKEIKLRHPELRRHVYRGNAVETIREVVDHVKADLLVMGTQCRTGVSGFLIGNTAESVLSDVKCSVLAIKPESFVSPVNSQIQNSGIRWDAASEYSLFA
ncbi:universal stress protein [Novipirellula sp. SH528]|uniref:universal stress protein n=1 Tax=Novipirellula sp. SH528 TaxID=3454466 RepID=UPI003F9FA0DD